MNQALSGIRIIDITHVARDNVKMEVKDGLSGRGSEIETNIKTVGRMARSDDRNCLVNCRPNPGLLGLGQFIPNADVAVRNNENMTRIDRKGIPDPLPMVT